MNQFSQHEKWMMKFTYFRLICINKTYFRLICINKMSTRFLAPLDGLKDLNIPLDRLHEEFSHLRDDLFDLTG